MAIRTRGLVISMVTLMLIMMMDDVTAVRCYDCDYMGSDDGTSSCKDPIDVRNPPTSYCTGTYCLKRKGSANGYQAVQRGCTNSGSTKDKYSSITFLGMSGSSCTCETARCNTSPRVWSSVYTLVTSVATVWISYLV